MATATDGIFKTLLGFLTNPLVLAGAGGFAGYHYFGKGKAGKMPYYYALGGAALGYLAGKGAQSYLGTTAAASPGITAPPLSQLPATTVIPQTSQQMQQQQVPQAQLPQSSSPPASAQPQQESIQDILDSYGSFDDGEHGSLTPDKGWSEDEALSDLAEVDTDVVSLGVRNSNGKRRK